MDNIYYQSEIEYLFVKKIQQMIDLQYKPMKKDIVDIEHAVETVKSLQGVKYKFKEGDDKERIGLIAQDVEPYVPQVVFEKEDDGMKSVSYQSLVALLIEAVKEQQKEIDELKAQVWLSR